MDNNTENKREKGFGRRMSLGEKIKLAICCLAIFLFAIWMSSFTPLVLILFAIDIYWTNFIYWSWWRNLKNRFFRELMSWVDAIVFAILAVWVIQNFFFQNFQIPTTSLEKTMMAGDYLLVSKYEYGPRKPMTPLSLPIFQHTIDLFGANLGKSYLTYPQVDYERMPGLRGVKRGDIVVFNYPMGDSILAANPTADYYNSPRRGRYNEDEVIWRPVDRRENYVKRCIGLPGETLKIVDRQVYIDGTAIENPRDLQQLYFVYSADKVIPEIYWHNLGIYTKETTNTRPDVACYAINRQWAESVIGVWLKNFGCPIDSIEGQHYIYEVNMTKEKAAEVAKRSDVLVVEKKPLELESYSGVFPDDHTFQWKPSNFGPLQIPKRGLEIVLNAENEALYGRAIRVYEGNTLEKDGKGGYILNGQPATSYTFKMDYYWMMGDNRDNSADSRFWGFVPEDHIVGTPLFIWFSVDPETGDVRWDRVLKSMSSIY